MTLYAIKFEDGTFFEGMTRTPRSVLTCTLESGRLKTKCSEYEASQTIEYWSLIGAKVVRIKQVYVED